MKNILKGKLVTVIILIATIILAGVAVFTAIRLYQLRQVAVAPTAPTSKPEAAVASPTPKACTALTFNLTTTPAPTPTGSPVATSTPTPSSTPTPTATGSPVATSTPTPVSGTATPTSAPGATATPSPEAALPSAGTSYPTIIGIGVGVLLLIGSLLLAL